MLSTVVFAGDADGNFIALDALTGRAFGTCRPVRQLLRCRQLSARYAIAMMTPAVRLMRAWFGKRARNTFQGFPTRAFQHRAEKAIVGSQLASTPRRGCLRLGTYNDAVVVCAGVLIANPLPRNLSFLYEKGIHVHDGSFKRASKSSTVNTLLSTSDRPLGGRLAAQPQPHFRPPDS